MVTFRFRSRFIVALGRHLAAESDVDRRVGDARGCYRQAMDSIERLKRIEAG